MIENPCILNDVTRCIGCEECVAACKRTHDLPQEDPPPRVGRSADGLTATRWTSITRRDSGANVRKQCRHCLEPACVSVCPVGALQKTPEGPVVYDKSICMGCRYCMMGCPYGIPHYEWDTFNPSVRKCVMCYDKMASGELDKPACVTACPKEATSFGPRDAMLAEARRRIAAEPNRYIDHVWGEHEIGGTRVLYISNVDLSFLAWKNLEGMGDLPDLTWHALRKVPYEFVGMGALMTGLWWILDRRQRLQREGEDAPGTAPTKGKEPTEESHE
jgi:formate dehydrogenase iron-sulfur subunit